MIKKSAGYFYNLLNKKVHYPESGRIELTYRCNLNCVYCYCKGSENRKKELTTSQWKKILNSIKKEGCIFLTITGGEPLARDDFLTIYSYAKKMGFIVSIFTNAVLLNTKSVNYLSKNPPYSVEVTLNSITEPVYEAITQVKGIFSTVIKNIKNAARKNIPLILKSNCLKHNKNEIVNIKAFAEKLLGKKGNKFPFKYDPMIYPRLNGDKKPLDYRLSADELLNLRKQDTDIWRQYEMTLSQEFLHYEKDKDFLYRCDAWMKNFTVNPYGVLKFCNFSYKFSTNLTRQPFKYGFYKVFPRLLNEKFKTNSRCINCRLKEACYHCPARAYLETGSEESPVRYYCQIAKAFMNQRKA
ncbi:MAG: radical SAM protein [Candidatus Omnitrophica bacterium]|nr:radical SAM protein [Candidatus Omnitrophota bacterium]